MDTLEQKLQSYRKVTDLPGYGSSITEFHCLLVAYDIAEVLLRDGKDASIRQLQFEDSEERRFKPLRYPKDQKGWVRHFVCVSEEKVIDPLSHQAVSIEDYCLTILGEIVPDTVYHTHDELVTLLQK